MTQKNKKKIDDFIRNPTMKMTLQKIQNLPKTSSNKIVHIISNSRCCRKKKRRLSTIPFFFPNQESNLLCNFRVTTISGQKLKNHLSQRVFLCQNILKCNNKIR